MVDAGKRPAGLIDGCGCSENNKQQVMINSNLKQQLGSDKTMQLCATYLCYKGALAQHDTNIFYQRAQIKR